MSKPRHWWWSAVKQTIRQYPKLREKKTDMQSMTITSSVESGGAAGGDGTRKTERYALRKLPPAEESALEAVTKALEYTLVQPNGIHKYKLIELYYFCGFCLSDAANKIFIDEKTAKRWNGVFVRMVAKELGYLTPQEDRHGAYNT